MGKITARIPPARNPTDQTADNTSIFGRLMLLKLTVKYLPTNTIAANINGAVKAEQHAPMRMVDDDADSVGPITGAAVNIMVITPIAVPRLLGGKIDNTPLTEAGQKTRQTLPAPYPTPYAKRRCKRVNQRAC